MLKPYKGATVQTLTYREIQTTGRMLLQSHHFPQFREFCHFFSNIETNTDQKKLALITCDCDLEFLSLILHKVKAPVSSRKKKHGNI